MEILVGRPIKCFGDEKEGRFRAFGEVKRVGLFVRALNEGRFDLNAPSFVLSRQGAKTSEGRPSFVPEEKTSEGRKAQTQSTAKTQGERV